ncbi:MAG TPA: polyprenyl synthetase family protein [Gemmatimonadales bacterium]|nr:polyprenyl synthetase family protein [Gemmatimonadales bacterium]
MDQVLSLWARRVEQEFGSPLGSAMAYALESPGKRLRPALLLAAYRALGGVGAVAQVAAAVEVVHSYSLVHDDLPCMDDDDMRRGRPTVHRQFDTRTATEAGYRMIPLSARVLASGVEALGLGPVVLGALGLELFRAAGVRGMVGGQVLDLAAEGRELTQDDLILIHRRKTGALIAASVVMGAIAAGADPARVTAMRGYGEEIGLAFQIADDLLDQNATSVELGKTAGKDARRRKPTFATLMDRAAAEAEAARCVERGVAHLRGARIDSTLLHDLAQFIVNRRS